MNSDVAAGNAARSRALALAAWLGLVASPAIVGVTAMAQQGFDAVVSQWRILVGPKALTPGQIAFWENVMHRMMEADEWKKELEENYWISNFQSGAETRKFLARDHVDAKAFLTELGLAK
jgi:putative tricarboxylic transport membrane protein